MHNKLNMWPAKARLSTTVYQGDRNAKQATPRSELTKVQRRFEQAEQEAPVSDTDKYFALLPVNLWRMYPLFSSYIIHLFDMPEGVEGRTIVSMFIGKTAGEAAKKCVEYVQGVKETHNE